jgi:DNA-binding MarR family transcriptional regulator
VLQLAQALQDNFAAHAAAVGLTANEARVMMALQAEVPVAQRALADQLRYDPSNLAGLIDRLEQLGAVQRQPGKKDRRTKLVVLAEPGRQIFAQFMTRLTREAGPFKHLSTEQVRTLHDALAVAVATE